MGGIPFSICEIQARCRGKAAMCMWCRLGCHDTGLDKSISAPSPPLAKFRGRAPRPSFKSHRKREWVAVAKLFREVGDFLIGAKEQFSRALHPQESQMLHGAPAQPLLTPLAQKFRTASDFGRQQFEGPFELKVGNHNLP